MRRRGKFFEIDSVGYQGNRLFREKLADAPVFVFAHTDDSVRLRDRIFADSKNPLYYCSVAERVSGRLAHGIAFGFRHVGIPSVKGKDARNAGFPRRQYRDFRRSAQRVRVDNVEPAVSYMFV